MVVEIKTWEEMKKEFGLDSFGYINCNDGFTTAMEEDMPEYRVIEVEKIFEASRVYRWRTMWNGKDWFWKITDDMIKRVIEE
jgi:hypothetical protein